MLDVDDLLQTDRNGRGIVNILAADELIRSPKLYATFLLWMLSELFEQLPEVGDPEKPTLVFFFDEAHLLFTDAPRGAGREDRAGRPADSLERRRRLLRHAEPVDIPDTVLGPARQPRAARAARVHAARSEGGEDRRRHAAARIRSSTSARRSPSWRSARRSSRCSTRRAARRSPSARGSCRPRRRSARSPTPQRDAIRRSRRRDLRPLRADGRSRVGVREAEGANRGRTGGRGRRRRRPATPESRRCAAPAGAGSTITDALSSILLGTTGPRGGHHDGLVQSAAKSAARSVGSGLGRAILRGALGSILGGTTSRLAIRGVDSTGQNQASAPSPQPLLLAPAARR